MKKLILLLPIILFFSCKKYDKCCVCTGHDETNNLPYKLEQCKSNMNKKEYDEFMNNDQSGTNYALINCTSMKTSMSAPFWINVKYECK